jgi:hypothetical protein
MPTEKVSTGDHVKVVSGIYAGSEGFVEDIQVECTVYRIKDREGENIYAMADSVVKTPQPI